MALVESAEERSSEDTMKSSTSEDSSPISADIPTNLCVALGAEKVLSYVCVCVCVFKVLYRRVIVYVCRILFMKQKEKKRAA